MIYKPRFHQPKTYRRLNLVALTLLLLAVSGFQVTVPAPGSFDISQTIQTLGQYGLLAWLIVRAEVRQAEQSAAWRDERRWMIGIIAQAGGFDGEKGSKNERERNSAK